MSLPKTEKIWHNGKFIKWDDATIHVLSHVVSYGSAVFEGIRCYDAPQGPAIFRLREHMRSARPASSLCAPIRCPRATCVPSSCAVMAMRA
jgi:branched-chain amino acid aminotransferase